MNYTLILAILFFLLAAFGTSVVAILPARNEAGVVARSVTPYQKVADYFKNRNFKDKTFFLADQVPTAWEVKQETFEGEKEKLLKEVEYIKKNISGQNTL